MKTATTTPSSVMDMPVVQKAQAKIRPVLERYQQATEREEAYLRILGQSPETADVLERLEAESGLAAARIERLKAERDLEIVQREEREIREAARVELGASYQPALREAVAALRTALIAARAANARVMEIQFAQHTATARPFDPVSVVSLDSLVDGWLIGTEALGFGAEPKS